MKKFIIVLLLVCFITTNLLVPLTQAVYVPPALPPNLPPLTRGNIIAALIATGIIYATNAAAEYMAEKLYESSTDYEKTKLLEIANINGSIVLDDIQWGIIRDFSHANMNTGSTLLIENTKYLKDKYGQTYTVNVIPNAQYITDHPTFTVFPIAGIWTAKGWLYPKNANYSTGALNQVKWYINEVYNYDYVTSRFIDYNSPHIPYLVFNQELGYIQLYQRFHAQDSNVDGNILGAVNNVAAWNIYDSNWDVESYTNFLNGTLTIHTITGEPEVLKPDYDFKPATKPRVIAPLNPNAVISTQTPTIIRAPSLQGGTDPAVIAGIDSKLTDVQNKIAETQGEAVTQTAIQTEMSFNLNSIVNWLNLFWENMAAMFKPLFDWVSAFWTTTRDLIAEDFKPFQNEVTTWIDNFWLNLTTKYHEIFDPMVDRVVDAVTNLQLGVPIVPETNLSEKTKPFGINDLFFMWFEVLFAIIRLVLRFSAFVLMIGGIAADGSLLNSQIITALDFFKNQTIYGLNVSVWTAFSGAFTIVLSVLLFKKAKAGLSV